MRRQLLQPEFDMEQVLLDIENFWYVGRSPSQVLLSVMQKGSPKALASVFYLTRIIEYNKNHFGETLDNCLYSYRTLQNIPY